MTDAFNTVVMTLFALMLLSYAVMHAWDVADRRGRAGECEFDNHGDGI